MTETYMSKYLENKVGTTTKRIKAVRAAGMVLGPAGVIGGIALSPALYALIPLSIALLVVALRRKSSWRAGMEGEQRLRGRLRQILDPRSAVFYNVPVAGGDIDCLAVTPQGIWAIEGKHYSGHISYKDGHWCRLRKRKGEIYPEAMRSPSAQLARGIMNLKSYFLSQGVSAWIRGVVVFTHPQVSLDVGGLGNVSAMTLSDLTALPPGPEIPEQMRSAIIEALQGLRTPTTVRRKCA